MNDKKQKAMIDSLKLRRIRTDLRPARQSRKGVGVRERESQGECTKSSEESRLPLLPLLGRIHAQALQRRPSTGRTSPSRFASDSGSVAPTATSFLGLSWSWSWSLSSKSPSSAQPLWCVLLHEILSANKQSPDRLGWYNDSIARHVVLLACRFVGKEDSLSR